MSLYKQPNSEVWWISLSHGGQRVRRSSGETDREQAQRRHDELKAELWRVTPKIRGRTWGMAVTHWTGIKPRSESELLSLVKFSRYFPDRVLTQVTREAVHGALDQFCKTAGTYMRYRTMIAAILNAAKEEGWLREVPKLAVKKDKKKAKARKWITRDEWAKLYSELPAHLKPMAVFAIETGVRQANVFGLSWDRVDLKRKLVWVEAEDTKGDKAIAVPLSVEALNVLQTQGESEDRHKTWVFTYRGKSIKKAKTAFQAACVRAGVATYGVRDGSPEVGDRVRYKGFTWHGFRHTWATWHVQNGTPLDVLQKLGGWADLRMVMEYAHHAPGFVAGYADNASEKK